MTFKNINPEEVAELTMNVAAKDMECPKCGEKGHIIEAHRKDHVSHLAVSIRDGKIVAGGKADDIDHDSQCVGYGCRACGVALDDGDILEWHLDPDELPEVVKRLEPYAECEECGSSEHCLDADISVSFGERGQIYINTVWPYKVICLDCGYDDERIEGDGNIVIRKPHADECLLEDLDCPYCGGSELSVPSINGSLSDLAMFCNGCSAGSNGNWWVEYFRDECLDQIRAVIERRRSESKSGSRA